MTKKMFQVTRAGMVAVTIFICLNLLLDKKVMVGDGHIWERCAWLLISLVAFLAVSVLYEKKRKIFSVGYLFLLINVFIDGVLCPGYFTDSRDGKRGSAGTTGFLSTLFGSIFYYYGSNIPISVMCETDDR